MWLWTAAALLPVAQEPWDRPLPLQTRILSLLHSSTGDFPPWGTCWAVAEEAKARGCVLQSLGRADEVPQGKEALAGNVGQVRRAGSARHSTGTQAQPEGDTRTFSWTLFPTRPSAHSFPTQQTQCSKQPCLGTAKLWVFSITP